MRRAALFIVAALAFPLPAFAAFDYVPPAPPPVFAEAEAAAGTLAERLARLAPEGTRFHWDAGVDPGRAVTRDYGDWESLLVGEGLAWTFAPPDLAIRPAAAEPAAAAEETAAPPTWRVVSGELLRDVLERWGGRAGVDVVWLTDRRWRIDGSRAFQGEFAHAVRSLLFALSHLGYAPAGEVSADGRTLAVVHRVPASEEHP